MRGLLFHNGSDIYGASKSFLRLCSRLALDGIDFKAVLPHEGPLSKLLRQNNVDVEIMVSPVIERSIFLSAKHFLRFIRQSIVSLFYVSEMVRKFRPDFIHSNTSIIFIPSIVSWIFRVPHIWHIRESFSEFGVIGDIYKRYMGWRADKIIAVSTPIADQFMGMDRKKVVVIYNGFTKDEFTSPSLEETDDFIQKYQLKDKLVVGLVGRIKYVRKGQEFLVKAAASLRKKWPDVRYLIVGSPFPGNEKHLINLQKLIKDLNVFDIVFVTGEVEKITVAYSAFDISVLASGLPEPFGGVVIESMAMGIPVIGTSIGGTVEQIKNNVTGFLVAPRDVNELASALEVLYADVSLRVKMGEAGRERFNRKFTFEPFYERIIEIYTEMGRV